MGTKLYCYHLPPIDFWTGSMTEEEMLSIARRAYFHQDDVSRFRNSMADLRAAAHPEFRLLGWEGDIREGPYYFALPMDDGGEMLIGYAVKQDNNGSTFVASPVPLPHLDALAQQSRCADIVR